LEATWVALSASQECWPSSAVASAAIALMYLAARPAPPRSAPRPVGPGHNEGCAGINTMHALAARTARIWLTPSALLCLSVFHGCAELYSNHSCDGLASASWQGVRRIFTSKHVNSAALPRLHFARALQSSTERYVARYAQHLATGHHYVGSCARSTPTAQEST